MIKQITPLCNNCHYEDYIDHSFILIFTSSQYVFLIDEEQEILVSLEQWDKRIDKDRGKSNDTIGCTIMKVGRQ